VPAADNGARQGFHSVLWAPATLFLLQAGFWQIFSGDFVVIYSGFRAKA